MLAVFVGAAQVVYLAGIATLGVRLLRRGLRSGEPAERLLAAHFLLCLGLGYVLISTALAAARSPGVLAPDAITALIAAGQLCSCLGVWAGAAFTRRVFRPVEPWARALLGAISLVLAAGYAASAAGGGFGGGMESGAYRLLYGSYTAVAIWVLAEPLRYWTAMRRRLRLGLADPVVVNRFFLWSAGSLARLLMLLVGGAPILVAHLFESVAGMSFAMTTVALLGLVVVGSYWLTFFPTQAYLRLVARRAGALDRRG
jgi:hypothetical protein